MAAKAISLMIASLFLTPLGQSQTFSVVKRGDVSWLKDPSGKLFLSKGVNVVMPQDGLCKEGAHCYNLVSQPGFDRTAWARSASARLGSWGFNSVGSWSDEEAYKAGLPFTAILNLVGGWNFLRLFDAGLDEEIYQSRRELADRFKDQPGLIGWFLDNELPWYGQTGWPSGGPGLLDRFSGLPAGGAGRKAADEFKAAWDKVKHAAGESEEEAFAGVVAHQYGELTSRVLKRLDPAHMNLGVRFAGGAPESVIKALAPYCDLVSINIYRKGGHVARRFLARVSELSGGKALLITEWSYRAMENNSGNGNTKGADVTVPTQADRGTRARSFLTELLSLPCVVGYHWFMYFDESPEGRTLDGEDSNYGLVDIHDQEYTVLTTALKEMNAKADGLHAQAKPLAGSLSETQVTAYQPQALKAETLVLGPGAPTAEKPYFWGDQSGGASSTVDSPTGEAWFSFRGKTGGGWGLGWGLMLTAAGGGRDLSGPGGFWLRVRAPQGLKFSLFLHEAGAASPDSSFANLPRGADGESWESPQLVGRGAWADYDIAPSSFKHRESWGNQGGNETLDLQAVQGFDISVPGGQGDFSLDLGALKRVMR